MEAVRLGRPGESSSPSSRNYDVFLSFRGEGAAKSFTNQLYAALVQAGLNTFKAVDNDNDDEDVIERAIEQSRVSIIVFSSNEYSDDDATSWSKWCVEEIAKILECTRTLGKNSVYPVYYGVDQAQVKARITKALSRYEEDLEVEMEDELRKEKVKKWRNALNETFYWSELEPWVLLNPADISGQSSLIRIIIEVIRLNLKEEYSRPKERKQDDKWFGKEIHLVNSRLSKLPENPDCPILKKLFLQHNSDLAAIPISFFNRMPALKVLDLSDTSIKSLPPSIACLDRLGELVMRDCQLLMELPAEIGALCNLKVLDLEGTKLICLPEEIRSLLKLVRLKFSLNRCSDKYRESRGIEAIIPRATLLKFYQLKELSIDVDPDCEWWDVEVEAIINQLSNLRNLQTLKLYLPNLELLQQFLQVTRCRVLEAGSLFLPLMYPTLSNFRLIVGRHEHRIVSCLPVDLQVEFEKLEKCLKYVNGEGGRSTDDKNIGQALKHAGALFLERHWSIEKLSSVFNIDEMDKLKFCLLVECNEMKAVVDGGDFYQQGDDYNTNAGGKPTLGSLQYLGIYYMKSLERIWKGPIVSGCLSSLRILAINTCPNLSTIFSPSLLLRNLTNLKELTLEDCPKLKNVVTAESSVLEYSTHHEYFFLPSLEKISLLHLPELVSIFSDLRAAPKLERMLVYNCPNLKTLSPMEMLSKKIMKEIKGEREWWEALEWHKSDAYNYLLGIFSPLKSDGDLVDEFAEAENQSLNTLRMFQTPTHSQEANLEELNVSSSLLSGQSCRLFSIAEIISATHNFDDALVIGEGGFGKMYRGVMDNGTITVAIKRLYPMCKQGAPEFWTDIEMLSNIRHCHIVSLIGYCNQSDEMILVYEYMVRGSLADHLYKNANHSTLSWVQRLKICIGAAHGLNYLHTGTDLQHIVIHRDVKSSNILLDDNWAAKISNFGMSKIFPANQSRTHVSTNVKGTFGYVDPEYFLTHRLTSKSDVYAFGVVLFEVLCGRRAVDFRLEEEQQVLVGWAQHCIKEGTLEKIIDPNLRWEILPNSLTVFAKIAEQCLHYHSKKRPTMFEVLASLELALSLQVRRDSFEFEGEIFNTSGAEDNQENVNSNSLKFALTLHEEMDSSMFDGETLKKDEAHDKEDKHIDGITRLGDASSGQSHIKTAKKMAFTRMMRLFSRGTARETSGDEQDDAVHDDSGTGAP